MHPLPAFLGFLAALVAFVALWDNLIYVDIRDRKRKLRWRRHASAEDQAIRCEYCLQPIESRRDVFTAKDRYLGRFRLLYVLHGRCARTLERTGRWKIRPAGQWGRMLIDVTAMWAGTFALAAVLAPRTDLREMWIVLPLFYAIVLSLRCDYYLRVERRIPEGGCPPDEAGEDAPRVPPPPSLRRRTDIQEAMIVTAAGLLLMWIFVPSTPPSFASLDRIEGTVARTWTTKGRGYYKLHVELRTGHGTLHLRHDLDHSVRRAKQLTLPVGARVTAWIAPSGIPFDGARTIWQLEYERQLLLAYEEIGATRAVERVGFGAFSGGLLVIGLVLWLYRILRPAAVMVTPAAGGLRHLETP